jgi:hypothetical protein
MKREEARLENHYNIGPWPQKIEENVLPSVNLIECLPFVINRFGRIS